MGHPHLRSEDLPAFVDSDCGDSFYPDHRVHQPGQSLELVTGGEDQDPGALGIEMHDRVVAAQGRPRMHRPDDTGELDEMAVEGTAQQLASRDIFRLRQAGFSDYLE